MDTPVYPYLLQKEHLLHAQKLYRKHHPRAALSYYLWIWIVPLLGVCLVLAYIAAVVTRREDLIRQLGPAAALGAWLAVFIPAMRWWQIRKLWKASLDRVADGKPVTLQFDNEQLISAIPGKSEGRFFWTAILDFAEDDHLALIFIRKKNFSISRSTPSLRPHGISFGIWRQQRPVSTATPSQLLAHRGIESGYPVHDNLTTPETLFAAAGRAGVLTRAPHIQSTQP